MPQAHQSANTQPANTQPPEGRSRAPSEKLKKMAAEAQEKAARKAATQEKAQARKAKQAKTKAKVAEREHRQNQENIPLDTRQWSEDDFRQPAPQDATFRVRDVSTGIKATPINLSVRTSKIPPTRISTTVKPVARDSNLSKTPARVLTAGKASELVHRRTQTPSVVSQAHRPTARQTSSHVTSIFYGREGDSPEPFEDPLDRLEFPESPSPGDDDYEPGADDYEPGEDDYEPNEDELDVDHATPSPNG